MKNTTYIPLRNDLLVRLIGRGGEQYYGLVEYAIEDFLDRTEEDYGEGRQPVTGQGYSWNQLLLPEGTQLRTRYRSQWETAEVRKGRFSYKDNTYDSPSKVCNAMRGDTSNNAWLTLEIKRPQDVAFRIADHFRR